eukprot:Tbor_TRINITY_DN4369_c0_g2::TRINITY_DN4369_c0_g2_i1::g.7687::m.7687
MPPPPLDIYVATRLVVVGALSEAKKIASGKGETQPESITWETFRDILNIVETWWGRKGILSLTDGCIPKVEYLPEEDRLAWCKLTDMYRCIPILWKELVSPRSSVGGHDLKCSIFESKWVQVFHRWKKGRKFLEYFPFQLLECSDFSSIPLHRCELLTLARLPIAVVSGIMSVSSILASLVQRPDFSMCCVALAELQHILLTYSSFVKKAEVELVNGTYTKTLLKSSNKDKCHFIVALDKIYTEISVRAMIFFGGIMSTPSLPMISGVTQNSPLTSVIEGSPKLKEAIDAFVDLCVRTCNINSTNIFTSIRLSFVIDVRKMIESFPDGFPSSNHTYVSWRNHQFIGSCQVEDKGKSMQSGMDNWVWCDLYPSRIDVFEIKKRLPTVVCLTAMSVGSFSRDFNHPKSQQATFIHSSREKIFHVVATVERTQEKLDQNSDKMGQEKFERSIEKSIDKFEGSLSDIYSIMVMTAEANMILVDLNRIAD